MQKSILLSFFLVFFLSVTSFAADVSQTFVTDYGETTTISVRRENGKILTVISVSYGGYAFLGIFDIRQNGWQYSPAVDWSFYDSEGNSDFGFDDSESPVELEIKKME